MTQLNRERSRAEIDEEAWQTYSAVAAAGHAGPEAHLEGALIAQRLGRRHSARRAILDALSYQPNGELKGRIRFVGATLLREIGDFDAAISEFTTWIKELEQYPTLEASHLGAGHYNLALALRQAERFSDSIHHYELACAEFRRRDRPAYLLMALYNLAWVACRAGRADLAAAALAETEPQSHMAPFCWHHRVTQAFLEAISATGDLHRVMDLCREIIEATDVDIPASVRSHSYWLSGRVALELSLVDTAQVMVELAMIHAARAGDANRCLGDADQLLQEIRERQQVDQEIPAASADHNFRGNNHAETGVHAGPGGHGARNRYHGQCGVRDDSAGH